MFDKDNLQAIINELGISVSDIAVCYPRLLNAAIKPSDLKVGARTFFHWNKQGLISVDAYDDSENSTWSKLNLIESIWVKIIISLRDFGFPLKEIKKIKDRLYVDFFTEFNMHADEILNALDDKVKNVTAFKDFKNTIKALAQNPEFRSPYHKALSTVIGSITTFIILKKSKINLLIYKKGNEFVIVLEGFGFEHYTSEFIFAVKRKAHICIPINDLIDDFIDMDKNEKISTEIGLLSPAENVVLSSLRDGKVKEIIIKKDHEDNLHITTTEKGRITSDKIALVKRILCLNEYDDVRVILRNEKDIYIENKIKKKIKTR